MICVLLLAACNASSYGAASASAADGNTSALRLHACTKTNAQGMYLIKSIYPNAANIVYIDYASRQDLKTGEIITVDCREYIPDFTENLAPQYCAGVSFPDSYYTISGSNRITLKFKVTNTSEYLNLYTSSGISDMKPISTWSWTGDSDQKFVVYRAGDNITTLRMYDNTLYALATSSGNCILRYLLSNNLELRNVTISSIRSEFYSGPFYGWSFDLQAGGCLTATNTNTSVSGGKMVRWEGFTANNTRQIWNVDKI